MINPIENYEWAGRKAGEAARYQLWSEQRFHSDWAKRAIALERGEEREQAQKAYDDAYKMYSRR